MENIFLNSIKESYQFNSQIQDYIDSELGDWKYSEAGFYYSSIGEYEKTLKIFDVGVKEKKADDKKLKLFNDKYIPKDAMKYILNESKKADIILINEAHHQSQHRIFTTKMLKNLFDEGYKNLGVEAFYPSDDKIHERKYPFVWDVLYFDPQFGELIRTALEIGFNVFPYDYNNSPGGGDDINKEREIIAARNIEKEMVKKPSEKFLIYCGYDHALEGFVGGSFEKMLAGRLTEFTNKNLLTINQCLFTEKSENKFNEPIYNKLKIEKPTVFVDKLSKSYQNEGQKYWFDIFVFHPRTKYYKGRPSWLFSNGKEARNIKLDKIYIKFPCLVAAFKDGENIKMALPIDIIEVENKMDEAYLALKKGNYSIVVQNNYKEGRVIKMKF